MKKRCCLAALAFVIFLLFSLSAFAAAPDKWAKCQSNCPSNINKCTGSGDQCCQYYENAPGTNSYCCAKGGWQTGECASCTDNDGDYYIKEPTDIALCGLECGPSGNLECSGNNDCNDNNQNINPGKTEICNAIDDNCKGVFPDEGCDDDKDSYADSGITCTGNFIDGNLVPKSCTTNSGDCQDTNSNINPGKTEVCNGIDDNCDGNIDEGCDDDKDAYADSGMTCTGSFIDGKLTPESCTTNSGDCNDNDKDINPGVSENTDALCSDGKDNNCNEDNDAAWDNNAATGIDCKDISCAGKAGPNNALCCQTAANCGNDDCKIESCVSNICSITNRNQCTSNECPAGSYCDAAGGNCQAPDASSPVCLNCAPDQTTGTWTWTPPNHQDAGKGFNANLFNSNAGPCLPPSGGSCYDSNNNPVNHKSALSTSACCGDDANEYYKPDYYGPECAADVNDCVWSTGDAQASNTGNKEYWCYQHEWSECKVNADIGKKVGGVTCAGTASSKAWTPNSLVKPENQYSCTDSMDNDADGKIDCADSDCAGTISGSVKDTNNNPIGSAKIDVLKNAVVVHTAFANALGSYAINDNQDVICGSYDMISSATGYVSSTKIIQLQPNQALQNVDFALALGTTCESDCTYAGDDLIHAECQGVNNCDLCNFNCGFCNPAIAASSCNLAKIGWIRDYNDPNQPECQETGCVIECGEGCPIAKIETKSSVTCDEENLIKVTKLVTYKGKLAKLVIVTCG